MFLLNTNLFAQFTENEIIESFKQGSTNCASISVIKLAISKYGLDNVFKSVKHENGNYHIVTHDLSLIHI